MKKIFISYSHSNSKEVDKIENYIKGNFNVSVERDIRKVKPLESLKVFMQSIRDSEKVICILSHEYLISDNCMYEVTELVRDDSLREPFLTKVIPVVVSSNSKPFKITKWNKQNEYLEYWLNQSIDAENYIKSLETKKKDSKYQSTFLTLMNRATERIKIANGIAESLDTFLTGICGQLHFNYYSLIDAQYSLLYDVLIEGFEPIKDKNIKPKNNFSKETLQKIIDRIKPKSYSDPNNPEFPYDEPKFPATDTIEYEINGKKILIKDESTNPTGTHKDRMAWEILLYYKRKLQSLVNSENEIITIPNLSMISSGSSALAIQDLLVKFGLPPLKVLIKDGFKESVYEKLTKSGCIIFKKDLTIKELKRDDVLKLTENKTGIEVSFRDAIDPTHIEYYDWMSYEILNENPTTVIVPFGSGELFTNIMNVNRKEVLLNIGDKRFEGNKELLKSSKFYGVTTTNPNSKYFKLCSYFFNCNQYNKEQMEMYKRLDICHKDSKVVDISDDFFEQAKELCDKLKLNTENSSLAGFAFYLENEELFKNEERVMIVNTGKTKEVLPPTMYIKKSGLSA